MIKETMSKIYKMIPNGKLKLYININSCIEAERKRRVADAKTQINNLSLTIDEKKRLFTDYLFAFNNHLVRFNEYYYAFHFPSISERLREEFLSLPMFTLIRLRHILKDPTYLKVCNNKVLFLEEFTKFVTRDWRYIKSPEDLNELDGFLNKYGVVIVKPTDSCSGNGVRKFEKGTCDTKDIWAKYKSGFLVEQCIENVSSLKEFHPSSLNTVRVTSISYANKCRHLWANIRTGNNNSVFDNADSGGCNGRNYAIKKSAG